MAQANEPSAIASSTAAADMSSVQRQRIRVAAVQLFTRQGFAGTSMKDLARALEIAPANIYNYYPNKEAILLDVLSYQLLALAGREQAILERQLSPADTLRELAYDLVVNDLNDPLAAFVGIQGVRGLSKENSNYISRLMADIRATWVAVINDGASSGAFPVRDPKLCALSTLTLCSSVSTWYQPGGKYSPSYVAEGVAEMVLRMVGCTP
jgi:TetR/AcrR family transcriptional regulator, cholesterol catabolism regulator